MGLMNTETTSGMLIDTKNRNSKSARASEGVKKRSREAEKQRSREAEKEGKKAKKIVRCVRAAGLWQCFRNRTGTRQPITVTPEPAIMTPAVTRTWDVV
jgi:hypothetical protein